MSDPTRPCYLCAAPVTVAVPLAVCETCREKHGLKAEALNDAIALLHQAWQHSGDVVVEIVHCELTAWAER